GSDRLALAALLRADPGISTGRIEEGHDRELELFGQPHEALRLAIAFRLRHAVIAAHALLGVAPLLVPDEHDRAAVESADAAYDRLIVRVHAIAVQLAELGRDHVEVV